MQTPALPWQIIMRTLTTHGQQGQQPDMATREHLTCLTCITCIKALTPGNHPVVTVFPIHGVEARVIGLCFITASEMSVFTEKMMKTASCGR